MREKSNVILFEKLLCAVGVLFETKVDDAADADVLQEWQRFLGGVAASVHPVRNPERRCQGGRGHKDTGLL